MLSVVARRPALLVAGSLVAVALAKLPRLHAEPTDGDVLPAPAEVSAQLDRLIAAEWERKEVTPAEPASDAEFLRRASLDLNGVIPTEEAVRAFLADDTPTKRADLVRRLLDETAYARSMATRWSTLLVGREYQLRSLGAKQRAKVQRARMQAMAQADAMDGELPDEVLSFDDWLEDRIGSNAAWDGVVRDLIAASGTVEENPAVHYALSKLRNGKAEELTGHLIRVFQAIPIQCAQCHDHPYAKWTQRQFYGVTAFLTRTQGRRSKASPEEVAAAVAKGKDPKKVRGPFQVIDRGNAQARLPADPGQTGDLILPGS